ncbi:MAG: ABC transporter permease [bacterium]|nr:ABC transporter permease [bacterium]
MTASRSLARAFWIAAGAALAFVVVPLLALYATQTPGDLATIAADRSVRAAIVLSLLAAIATAALAGLLGVPLAHLLARDAIPAKGIVAAIVDLPLAVPHTVVGIALLFVFGRTGVVGHAVEATTGLRFWGTAAGVIVAMLYVSLPYTVGAARIAFEGVEESLEAVSRTLGSGQWRTFWRVTLPLARRGIGAGLLMSGARALSEFGAVIILAYYPMTAPVKIYDLFVQQGLTASAGAAVLFLTIVLTLFIALRTLLHPRDARRGRDAAS